jgi:hypothetical protein
MDDEDVRIIRTWKSMHIMWKYHIKGGVSLGASGAKPHLIFGDQKKGKVIFENSLLFHLLFT